MSNTLTGFSGVDGLGGCGCGGRRAGMAGFGAGPDGLGAGPDGLGMSPAGIITTVGVPVILAGGAAAIAAGYMVGGAVGRRMPNRSNALVGAASGAATALTFSIIAKLLGAGK